MNREEEAVLSKILELMKKELSPIVLSVSDSVKTTPVPDETQHLFSVIIQSASSTAHLNVLWPVVPEEPEEIPGNLISNIIYELERNNKDLFKPYSFSPSKNQIKPNTAVVEFHTSKSIFEKLRDEAMGRILGTKNPNFLMEVFVEGGKAQVVFSTYEGRGPEPKAFEVFLSDELRTTGSIIQRVLNDAILNHFLGTVIKFEVKDKKGNLIDASRIPAGQNHIIFRKTN